MFDTDALKLVSKKLKLILIIFAKTMCSLMSEVSFSSHNHVTASYS